MAKDLAVASLERERSEREVRSGIEERTEEEEIRALQQISAECLIEAVRLELFKL